MYREPIRDEKIFAETFQRICTFVGVVYVWKFPTKGWHWQTKIETNQRPPTNAYYSNGYIGILQVEIWVERVIKHKTDVNVTLFGVAQYSCEFEGNSDETISMSKVLMILWLEFWCEFH